jgi:hypothetical protein
MGQDVAVSNEIIAAAIAEADRLKAVAIREATRETEEAIAFWERSIKKIVKERHISRHEAININGDAPYYTPRCTFHWTTIALLMTRSKSVGKY